MKRGKKKRDTALNKAQAQRRHARRRMLQRYGLDFTREHQEQAIRDICTGKARLLEQQSHRVSVWIVQVLGKEVAVAYDRFRRTIATALPEQVIEAGSTLRAAQ